MRKMNKYISILMLLTLVTFNTAQKNAPMTTNKTSELTMFDSIKSSLHDNSLRAGFEPFYYVTNLFIDKIISPKVPKEFIESPIESVKNVINRTIKHKEWKQLVIIPFKYYPSLSGLIIGVLFLVVFLPILGLLIMCNRCCCRGKFNPFDRKKDSLKRKFNATVLFILLLIILLGTVILFFTNQNSSIAMRKIPIIYKNKMEQVSQLLTQEIPDFLDKTNDQLEFSKEITSNLLEKTIVQVMNSTINSFNISSSMIDSFNIEISNELKNASILYRNIFLKNNNLVDRLSALIDTIDDESDEKSKLKILKNFLQSFHDQYKNIEGFNLKEYKIDNLIIELTKKLRGDTKFVFMNHVNELIKTIADGQKTKMAEIKQIELPHALTFINQTLNPKLDKFFTLLPLYYDYFYFIIMGICAFMLIMFILYTFGLAGMCARRTHHNYKQTCHRGVSANFLLAGVGFYFLFSWIILIVCIILFVPGILTRHGVCSPATQLEKNELFMDFKKNNNKLADLNFTRLVDDCHKTNRSKEIDRFLSKEIRNVISKQMIESKIDSELQKIASKFNEQMPSFEKQFFKQLKSFFDDLKKIISDDSNAKLNDYKKMLELLTEKINSSDDKSKAFLPTLDMDNVSNLIKTSINIIKKKKIIQELSDHFETNFSLQKLDSKTVNETIREFRSILEKGTELLTKSSPSCKIISETYSSVVLTGCYEILDNLNTFWFTLIILILIYILVVILSLSQADLFRKIYAYDELLSEETNNENKQAIYPTAQYEIFKTRGPTGNGPIDAYEMNGYSNGKSNNNENMIKNNANGRSPPQYRVTRA